MSKHTLYIQLVIFGDSIISTVFHACCILFRTIVFSNKALDLTEPTFKTISTCCHHVWPDQSQRWLVFGAFCGPFLVTITLFLWIPIITRKSDAKQWRQICGLAPNAQLLGYAFTVWTRCDDSTMAFDASQGLAEPKQRQVIVPGTARGRPSPRLTRMGVSFVIHIIITYEPHTHIPGREQQRHSWLTRWALYQTQTSAAQDFESLYSVLWPRVSQADTFTCLDMVHCWGCIGVDPLFGLLQYIILRINKCRSGSSPSAAVNNATDKHHAHIIIRWPSAH